MAAASKAVGTGSGLRRSALGLVAERWLRLCLLAAAGAPTPYRRGLPERLRSFCAGGDWRVIPRGQGHDAGPFFNHDLLLPAPAHLLAGRTARVQDAKAGRRLHGLWPWEKLKSNGGYGGQKKKKKEDTKGASWLASACICSTKG